MPTPPDVADEGASSPRKSRVAKLVPVGIAVLVVIAAFALLSRPVPGQRTNTDTSVRLVVGAGEAKKKASYPIGLREGGDPAHEADHVMEPLLGVNGVSAVTMDWSQGVVLIVEFDPAVVSSADIANAIAGSGYLVAPTQ